MANNITIDDVTIKDKLNGLFTVYDEEGDDLFSLQLVKSCSREDLASAALIGYNVGMSRGRELGAENLRTALRSMLGAAPRDNR